MYRIMYNPKSVLKPSSCTGSLAAAPQVPQCFQYVPQPSGRPDFYYFVLYKHKEKYNIREYRVEGEENEAWKIDFCQKE